MHKISSYADVRHMQQCFCKTIIFGGHGVIGKFRGSEFFVCNSFSFFQRRYRLYSAQWCSSQMVDFEIKLFGNYSLWYVSGNNLLKSCDIYWNAKFWAFYLSAHASVLKVFEECPLSLDNGSLEIRCMFYYR